MKNIHTDKSFKISIILTLVFLTVGAQAQKFIPFLKKNGKYIYVQQGSLKPLSQTEYEELDLFAEGLAGVRIGDKCGFIGTTGQLVIALKYQGVGEFYKGLAPVYLDNRVGLIDKQGNEVVPIKYSQIYSFSKGWVVMSTDNKYELLDIRGKELVAPKYDKHFEFNDGLARVVQNNKYGYIDESGREVTAMQYDHCESFEAGFGTISRIEKGLPYSGYVNKKGEAITPLKYQDLKGFRDGMAAVMVTSSLTNEGMWGYIDTTGTEIIPFIFKGLDNNQNFRSSFKEGLALIPMDSQWVFIDKTGKQAIARKFKDAQPFSEGLAAVLIDGKYGFINKTGEMVIKPQFADVGDFVNGIATISLNNKEGSIDKKGNFIVQPIYESMWDFREGYARVGLDGKRGFISETGKVVVPIKYKTPSFWFTNGLLTDIDGRKVFYIDSTGVDYREKTTLPPLNKVWGPSDYVVALDFLNQEYETNKTLPRVGDAVFKKLVDQENLSIFTDPKLSVEERIKSVQSYFEILPKHLILFALHSSANESLVFGQFILEATKRTKLLASDKMKELSEDVGKPYKAALGEGIFSEVNGMLKILGATDSKEDKKYRISLAKWFNENLTVMWDWLAENRKPEIKGRVEKISKSDAEKEIRKSMSALLKKLK